MPIIVNGLEITEVNRGAVSMRHPLHPNHNERRFRGPGRGCWIEKQKTLAPWQVERELEQSYRYGTKFKPSRWGMDLIEEVIYNPRPDLIVVNQEEATVAV